MMAPPNTARKMGGDSPKRQEHSSKEGNGLVKSGTSPSGTSGSDDGSWWGRTDHNHRPIVSPPLVYSDVSRASHQSPDRKDSNGSPSTSSKQKRKRSSHRRRVTFGDTRKRAAVDDGVLDGPVSPASSPDVTRQTEEDELQLQGDWGCRVPLEVLQVIFAEATRTIGALPTLVRLSRVCRLWRDAAFSPHLWRSVDLGANTKETCRTERTLMWLLEHRLTHVRELSLGKFKC